jgi:2-(1,2-epoxy-1,2-dihydrophenyl)acetyl-CoA isomerase
VNIRCAVVDNIGWITLDRPHCMNAITVALAGDLERAIAELGSAPHVNVLVIQGAGGNFCAGGDFDEVQRLRAQGPAALRELFDTFRRACDAIGRADVPVVGAVEGVAAAGGFELMQAADITLVSEEARITDRHVNYGMIPGGGSTALLPRLVGRQQALGLLLSGDKFSGLDAARLGLAYRAFPETEFAGAVHNFAMSLAARDRESTTTIKRLVNQGLRGRLSDALDSEIDAVVTNISGDAGIDSVQKFHGKAQEATR